MNQDCMYQCTNLFWENNYLLIGEIMKSLLSSVLLLSSLSSVTLANDNIELSIKKEAVSDLQKNRNTRIDPNFFALGELFENGHKPEISFGGSMYRGTCYSQTIIDGIESRLALAFQNKIVENPTGRRVILTSYEEERNFEDSYYRVPYRNLNAIILKSWGTERQWTVTNDSLHSFSTSRNASPKVYEIKQNGHAMIFEQRTLSPSLANSNMLKRMLALESTRDVLLAIEDGKVSSNKSIVGDFEIKLEHGALPLEVRKNGNLLNASLEDAVPLMRCHLSL
jgi:hypothetical protein